MKRKAFVISSIFIVIMMVFGVTYAFFSYTKVSTNNHYVVKTN